MKNYTLIYLSKNNYIFVNDSELTKKKKLRDETN